MESAALIVLALEIGLASSMSVLFGWQPMPGDNTQEGRPKVEYIVQLEPELVATLQAGQSIPITSDIPEGIGPIGRIRLVVGRDELPRQTLAAQFKPWPKQPSSGKQPRAGLVETQFTVPRAETSGSQRYPAPGATNSAILPPTGSTSRAANPLARALQQGAQEARNLATDVTQQILPPADQLFGAGGGSRQGFQNAIGNNVGDTGQDESTATILPPNSTPRAQINNGQINSKGRRIDEPVETRHPDRWQRNGLQRESSAAPANFAANSSPQQTNPSSQPGVFNAPWPSTTNNARAETGVSNPPPNRYAGQSSQPPAQTPGWSGEPAGRNQYDVANRQADNQPYRYADNRQPAVDNTTNGRPTGGEIQGPQFPTMGSQQPAQPNGDSTWAPPAITRDMLDAPAGGRVQTTSGNQQQTTARQNLDTQPHDFGWDQGNGSNIDKRGIDKRGMDGTGIDGTDAQNDTTLFPLLLSWVLLSGSGAGNAYLWWSYLDVRSKYRGVVHGSPSRHGRYDD